MAKRKNKKFRRSNPSEKLYPLGIVSIVAVVAIVVMLMNSGVPLSVSNEDITGEAYSASQDASIKGDGLELSDSGAKSVDTNKPEVSQESSGIWGKVKRQLNDFGLFIEDCYPPYSICMADAQTLYGACLDGAGANLDVCAQVAEDEAENDEQLTMMLAVCNGVHEGAVEECKEQKEEAEARCQEDYDQCIAEGGADYSD